METARYRVEIARHEFNDFPFYLFAPQDAAAEISTVFVLHGLNARKERHLEMCLQLTAANLRACMMDLRGHGERINEDTLTLRRDWSDPAFVPAIARTIMGSIQDVHALADYLELTRYAIIGQSLGGYTALLTALQDDRVRRVINISGSLDLSNLPPPFGGAAALRFDAAQQASLLKRIPLLLLHGDADATVPIAGARRLHAALLAAGASPEKAVLHEYPGIGHELTPAMIAEAVAFVAHGA